MNILPIPIVSQQDPRWANKLLGKSGLTLGHWGCLESDCSAVLDAFCIHETPGTLCDKINSLQGFDVGGNLAHQALPLLYPGKVFWWEEDDTTNAKLPNEIGRVQPVEALNRISRMISMGFPVPVKVSICGNPHWVNLVGNGTKLDGTQTFTANDPAFGDQIEFSSRYGDPKVAIQSFLFLIGEPIYGDAEGCALAQLVEAFSLMSSMEEIGPIGSRLKNAINTLIG